MEKEEQSYKKSKNIVGIIQSCLILILIVLIIFIMVNISRLQGTSPRNKLCRSGTWSYAA